MFNTLTRLFKDDSGATAIEYGLIAAMIAVGIIASAQNLGDSIEGIFTDIGTELDNGVANAKAN